jgi:hypothetical protein
MRKNTERKKLCQTKKSQSKWDPDCLELNVDGSVFKLSLDERGVPQFPESVKQQLPPYMLKAVERVICERRIHGQNEAWSLGIVHEFWCEELAGIGMCNCDPVLCPSELLGLGQWYEGSWGRLTCVVCHESSNGRMGSDRVMNNGDQLFVKHWVWEDGLKVGRCFWAFSNTTLICEECLRNIMAETGIDFPNVIDFRSSPSRARKPVLH